MSFLICSLLFLLLRLLLFSLPPSLSHNYWRAKRTLNGLLNGKLHIAAQGQIGLFVGLFISMFRQWSFTSEYFELSTTGSLFFFWTPSDIWGDLIGHLEIHIILVLNHLLDNLLGVQWEKSFERRHQLRCIPYNRTVDIRFATSLKCIKSSHPILVTILYLLSLHKFTK